MGVPLVVNRSDISLSKKTPEFLQQILPFTVPLTLSEHLCMQPWMGVLSVEIERIIFATAGLKRCFLRVRLNIKPIFEWSNARFERANKNILIRLTNCLHHFPRSCHISPPQP